MLERQSILKLERHEIFELTEALYTFSVLWHDGKWSDLYALQCEIGSYYKPSMGFSESEVEKENMYYGEITEDNAPVLWGKVKYILDNRWELIC